MKGKAQLLIVGAIVALWMFGAIVAAFGSNDLLKVTTPIATLAFGWLYADKAVGS